MAFRPAANLSIASCSGRASDAWTPTTFLYDLPLSKYRSPKSPLILGTLQHVATFLLLLQHWLIRYRLHNWQLGRSNRGITPTVTSDDLDLLL